MYQAPIIGIAAAALVSPLIIEAAKGLWYLTMVLGVASL